jgi:hypothetical protein
MSLLFVIGLGALVFICVWAVIEAVIGDREPPG